MNEYIDSYIHLICFCLCVVSYERILSIKNLDDVPNPWKGFTMNRCLLLALVVLLVSSGVNELHGELCSSHGILGTERKQIFQRKQAVNLMFIT